MTAAQVRRLVGLVGLGLRSRNVVVGAEQVRAAARKGRLALALVANDASENSLAKLLPLLRARRVRVVQVLDATGLGSAAGRTRTAAIGILDGSLAKGILGVVKSGPGGPV